jgi:ADP-ribosylglycohydrolase
LTPLFNYQQLNLSGKADSDLSPDLLVFQCFGGDGRCSDDTEMRPLCVIEMAKSVGRLLVELVVFQCFSVDGRCSDDTEMLTLSSLEMAKSLGHVLPDVVVSQC